MKKAQTLKLDPELIEAIKQAAKAENRSFNNMAETILYSSVEVKKHLKKKK
jgi:hypothetical protein